MRDAQILADKFAIANTLAPHSRGVDRADYPLLRSAYDDDASVAYGFFTGPADAFCRLIADAQNADPVTMHRTSNVWVRIDGDQARSKSYVVAYMESPDESRNIQRLIGGRYLDRHRRTADGWRLAYRTYVLDWNLNWPSSAVWSEADDDHLAPRGQHRGADPGRTLLAAWSAGGSSRSGATADTADNLDATLDGLLSRQAIHELSMAYCRAVDRGDETLMRSLFHPDASIVSGAINGGIEEFAPAIVAMIRDNLKSCFHSVANERVKITGETAVGESYVTAFTLAGDGAGAMQTISGGRYLDRYARRDGHWKIAERVFVMDFNINQPSTEVIGEGPSEHLTLHGGFKPNGPVFEFWDD